MKSRGPLLCFVTEQAGIGGIPRVARLVHDALSDRNVAVLTLLRDGTALPTLRDKCSFAARLGSLQVTRRPDWVFFDHLSLAAVQPLMPRSWLRPHAVFLHSIEVWGKLGPLKYRALREARVRIANSHYTADRIRAAHPEVGPISVCHLSLGPDREPGSNCAVEESAAPSSGLPNASSFSLEQIGADSVLIVGRMLQGERHKGHDQLIEAWPLVQQEVPKAQLVVVGEGDDLPRLRAKAQGNPPPGILFTGRVSDRTLLSIYEKVALFAMPARGEGFGLVYLEAMSHSLPCVASVHDAASEIVVHGETGFLVRQQDRHEISSAIITLLKDAELRRQFGDAGLRRWKSHFSFERFKKDLLDALSPLQQAD